MDRLLRSRARVDPRPKRGRPLYPDARTRSWMGRSWRVLVTHSSPSLLTSWSINRPSIRHSWPSFSPVQLLRPSTCWHLFAPDKRRRKRERKNRLAASYRSYIQIWGVPGRNLGASDQFPYSLPRWPTTGSHSPAHVEHTGTTGPWPDAGACTGVDCLARSDCAGTQLP